MQIDWITVAAQIVNFLVLVWLLQRLLYRPVTRAMERRAQAIRDEIAEAEQREADAAAEADQLRAAQQALEGERAEILARADAEAHDLRRDLEKSARDTVAEKRKLWEDQLEREKSEFLSELRRKTVAHVAGVARRALADLADADLNDRIAKVFIRRLHELGGAELEKLRRTAKQSDGKVYVTTSFRLSDTASAALVDMIREKLHPDAAPDFRLDPGLICGIRLQVQGQTLQWSVDAYLDDLEEEMARAVDDSALPDKPKAAE